MRVAILAPAISKHTKRWCSQLANSDIDVRVITAHPEDRPRVPSAGASLAVRVGFVTNAGRVRREIKEIRPQIVHAFYASGYGWWGARSGFHPLIVSVWGSEVTISARKSLLSRKMTGYNLEKADVICATSNYLKKRILELYPGVEDKIEVIPFGIDTQKFWSASKPNTTEAKFVVGTARRLERVYGLDILIRAFARVQARIPDSLLKIAGAGTQRENLERLAAALGIEDSVDFVGYVEQDDMPNFLTSLDVFAMPSREEAFGVASLEAMACRVPVVASKIGGNREILRDGMFGVMFESEDVEGLADGLISLAENESLRKQLGSAARKRVVEHYDIMATTSMMIDLYERVVEEFGTAIPPGL